MFPWMASNGYVQVGATRMEYLSHDGDPLKIKVRIIVPTRERPSHMRVNASPTVESIVADIRRADYEGDRDALQRDFYALEAFMDRKNDASRVRYWRGFARWRRAINGFNEEVHWREQEADILAAADEFEIAATLDPTFTDARIATASSLGYLLFMNRPNQDRFRELAPQVRTLLKTAQAEQPDNPRLAWVLGPVLWNTPVEPGGGRDVSIATYKRALESLPSRTPTNPLDPTWGEPELRMSLAWAALNQEKPDVAAAEQYARGALKLVPNWHYVRDILLPQIEQARAKLAGNN